MFSVVGIILSVEWPGNKVGCCSYLSHLFIVVVVLLIRFIFCFSFFIPFSIIYIFLPSVHSYSVFVPRVQGFVISVSCRPIYKRSRKATWLGAPKNKNCVVLVGG